MLCKKQIVLEGACVDGTSRAVRCEAGFANGCMKFCNERCEGFEAVAMPKVVRSSAYGRSVQSPKDRAFDVTGQDEKHGGCCDGQNKPLQEVQNRSW